MPEQAPMPCGEYWTVNRRTAVITSHYRGLAIGYVTNLVHAYDATQKASVWDGKKCLVCNTGAWDLSHSKEEKKVENILEVGAAVKISSIVDLLEVHPPLPAVGTIESVDGNYYVVRVKWTDHTNDVVDGKSVYRKIYCDKTFRVRRDWISEEAPQSEVISFSKAYDDLCRHNDAPYPQIGELRDKPQWFKVIEASQPPAWSHPWGVGDVVFVMDGYISNITRGWVYDPIGASRVGGPSSGGMHWAKWAPNICVCFSGVKVIPIEGRDG